MPPALFDSSRECGMIGSRTGTKPARQTNKNHRQKPMKPLSATAAAKVAHKSKLDILQAIKSGDMSATKNARGHWEIDPSELNRVFPHEVLKPNQEPNQKPIKTDTKTNETNVLEVELKFMREKLADKDDLIEELRSQRDKWQVQAERLLLEKPVQPVATPTAIRPTNQNTSPEAEKSRRGVLARFFGG